MLKSELEMELDYCMEMLKLSQTVRARVTVGRSQMEVIPPDYVAKRLGTLLGHGIVKLAEREKDVITCDSVQYTQDNLIPAGSWMIQHQADAVVMTPTAYKRVIKTIAMLYEAVLTGRMDPALVIAERERIK